MQDCSTAHTSHTHTHIFVFNKHIISLILIYFIYYIYIYICICIYYTYLYAIYYILVAPCFKNLLRLRLEAGYPALRCHNLKQTTGHTHNTHNTGTTTPPTHERITRSNHLAAIGGCATTVRATSHARVGGRAEVSMGSRVEVRRALARARVRRAPAGPSRPCQLEASRGHASDAAPAGRRHPHPSDLK